MDRPSRWRKLAGAAFVVVTGTHLIAKAVAPDGVVASVTQTLLMPALAGVLLAPGRADGFSSSAVRARAAEPSHPAAGPTDVPTSPSGFAAGPSDHPAPAARPVPLLPSAPSPLRRRVLLALVLSWLGDTLPRIASNGDVAFLLMLGPFLLAQLAYISAFLPLRREGLMGLPPARRLPALGPYAAALATMVALCAPRSGPMLPAILVYGLALATMAVLATGLGPMGAVGGAIFLVSDSLIGLRVFSDIRIPGHEVWVMATYAVGQLLLVLAVRARIRRNGSGS